MAAISREPASARSSPTRLSESTRVIWLWVVVIVAVVGGLSVVLLGRVEAMAEVYDDRPDSTVPTGRPLTAADLRDVRFSTGVRGYRMDEVDALLSRLQADLLARERLDAESRQEVAADLDPERPAAAPSDEPEDRGERLSQS